MKYYVKRLLGWGHRDGRLPESARNSLESLKNLPSARQKIFPPDEGSNSPDLAENPPGWQHCF